MRKFILASAMIVVSATAQAGASRGLTLASNGESAVPASATAEAPKSPALSADNTTQPPGANEAKSADGAPAISSKPKHRHDLTEARVIYELHRHGIYW